MTTENVNIILQSLMVNYFCLNYKDLTEKELIHLNESINYDNIPDRIIADDDYLHPYINWKRISKMKAIRLVSKNFDLIEVIDLKQYDYKIREIFWFIQVDYTRLFKFFNFDFDKCNHEDVYLLLCLGEKYFEDLIDIESYNFSFLEMMDIIRAYKYQRHIILRLNYSKLKNYQFTEIISNTGIENLDLFDIDDLSTLNWIELLNYQPHFIEKCDFEKFKIGDVFNLIQLIVLFIEPDLSYLLDDVDKSQITAFGWEKLLICNPNKFADICDFSKLNEDNWSRIVIHQPELLVHKL